MRSNTVFEFSLSPLIFDDNCFYDSSAAEPAASLAVAVAVAVAVAFAFAVAVAVAVAVGVAVAVAVSLVIFLVEGPQALGPGGH